LILTEWPENHADTPDRKLLILGEDAVLTTHSLYEVLSGLTPSRVRWLYRQRWETCRLNPGQLPLVSDLQYLQTTLKVLDDWRRQGIDVG
jgi:hypothetical protein